MVKGGGGGGEQRVVKGGLSSYPSYPKCRVGPHSDYDRPALDLVKGGYDVDGPVKDISLLCRLKNKRDIYHIVDVL